MNESSRKTGRFGVSKTTAHRCNALCCICGTVRTFSENYYGRKLPDVYHAENFNPRMVHEVPPFWRCLIGLKCATCGEFTRHAYIREDESRNYAEEWELRRRARRA